MMKPNQVNTRIYKIKALNTPKKISAENEDNYKNIKNLLYLSIGAKVFMTTNINTSIGLFNSSEGIVRDIVYEVKDN